MRNGDVFCMRRARAAMMSLPDHTAVADKNRSDHWIWARVASGALRETQRAAHMRGRITTVLCSLGHCAK
ncbi:MAG TPA: hypothetical protein VFF60_00995, partial [Candidatus Binatus sp.]|nr:hypothetical protein [Candidatus Binatus sp.]